MRGVWVGGLLLAIGLAACSTDEGQQVHDQWEERASLPSCGEVTVDLLERLEKVGRSELACLSASMTSGKGAELVVRSSTKEGDPVTTYYRVTPAGTTEVYIDRTGDENSGQDWGFAECKEPESVLDANC